MPIHYPSAAVVTISRVDVSAYVIPTDTPESDGTLEWDSTTLVAVSIHADGSFGLGYTYAHQAAASVIRDTLAEFLLGANAMDIPALWQAQHAALRNQGNCGIGMMALSAVDVALWDLKAKLLNLPVCQLLGHCREEVTLYGSGGFTSYGEPRLRAQLERWTGEDGLRAVKIKVGREPDADTARVAVARDVIGESAALMVDANSAYDRKEALYWMQRYAEDCGACWMEQPLKPDDLDGLRYLRDAGPAGMEIADGEYGWSLSDFRRFAEAGAIDTLMADLTRCGGITGLLKVGALCEAFGLPLSTHCAPSLHLHPGCALACLRHCEYFHDHARIEAMLFEGFPAPRDGRMAPDLSRPGLGLELREKTAALYRL